jgi:glycosyltransferase involved in cell wall biosynthesis
MEERIKKIKILYTIPNFDTAGSGKVLYDLAKGLDKNKFEVEIACKHNKGIFFAEVEKLNLPIHIIETTVNYKPYHSLYFRIMPIVKFFKDNKFDIIHSWHWSSDWTEVAAAKRAGLKYIFTKKAMSWGNIHWKIKSKLSHFIFTINDEMKNYFPNKKQQKLIPLGIDTNYYNPENFKIHRENNSFKIITIANLVPVKGIEILIKAIHLLKNKNIILEILGDDRDDYARDLKNLVCDLKADSKIKFLGKHKDIRPFLANSDLYVIPTLNEGRKEGMPMALVEAMCMAKPVLGSDISGINFVLKQFPELLFEASNVEQLKNKINEIYNKNSIEKEEMGKSLRKYCINHFSEALCIEAHENVYIKILKR